MLQDGARASLGSSSGSPDLPTASSAQRSEPVMDDRGHARHGADAQADPPKTQPLSSLWDAFGSMPGTPRALFDLQALWSVQDASEVHATTCAHVVPEELEEVFMVSAPSIDWEKKLGSRMSNSRMSKMSFASFARRVFVPEALEGLAQNGLASSPQPLGGDYVRDLAACEEDEILAAWVELKKLKDDCDAMDAEFGVLDRVFKTHVDLPARMDRVHRGDTNGANDVAGSTDSGPASKDQSVEKGGSKQEGASLGVSCCTRMWGGPSNPHVDDSLVSWFANFAGGVQTAHGINRVCDDKAGPLRTGRTLCPFQPDWDLVHAFSVHHTGVVACIILSA